MTDAKKFYFIQKRPSIKVFISLGKGHFKTNRPDIKADFAGRGPKAMKHILKFHYSPDFRGLRVRPYAGFPIPKKALASMCILGQHVGLPS